MSSHSDGNGTRAGRASREKKVQNPVPLGINYLLVIGIDQYQHCPKLYNAVKDATDVTGVLTEKYQFSKQLTFSLFDKAATQDNIIAALKDLAKKVTPKDTVLIYFSGHGEYDEVLDVGYWIPVDGRLGKIGSFISFDLVMKVLKAVKSHHTFIIADSCYSGTLFTEKSLNKVLNRLEQKPSRWLITAGRNEVVLDGKPGDNSPFADSVLWHLRNNHQPRLRVSQFCNDIIEDVGKNYDQVPRGASLKGVGDRGGEFMFRLKEYTLAVFDEEVAAAEEENRKRNLEEEKEATEALAETRTTIEPAPKKEETPIQSMDDLRKRLKQYIIQDEFERAFNLLHEAMVSDSSLENRVIMQQARFSPIKKGLEEGTLSQSDYNITKAQIRKALLSIIADLDEESIKPETFKAPSTGASRSTGFVEKLSTQEREGLEKQAEILQEKINFFRSQIDIISDISQKFTAQKQLEGFEKELQEVKSKLGV